MSQTSIEPRAGRAHSGRVPPRIEDSLILLVLLAVMLTSAPATGLPAAFLLIWAVKRAHQWIRTAGGVVALGLTLYAGLFLAGVVHYIYWQ